MTRSSGEGAPIYRQPAVLVAGASLVSLVLGVVLGRASVDVPKPPPADQVERSLSAAQKVVELESEPEPTDVFRVRFNRAPKDNTTGLERHDDPERPVAKFSGPEARLSFDLVPGPQPYALTAILRLEDGKAAKVQSSLDGHPLEAWTLGEGWAIYSSPVPRERVTEGAHELVLSVSELADAAAVYVDSVALAPVEDRINIAIGPAATGYLVDGFSKLEGKTVWSNGLRSKIGAFLAPEATTYQLRVRGSALPGLSPLSVGGRVNGTDVGAAEFTAQAAEVTWAVPARALRPGLNQVEFVYPKTGQPATFNPKSKDKRPLALRFSRIALAPAQ